jgi:Uma2 family endonuclease
MVVCDPSDSGKDYRERPTIIIEVISPNTELTDRREKALAYRHIPTIQNYVLVEQDRMAATIMHRAEPGWRSEKIEGPTAVVKLSAVNVGIPLAKIYQRTSLGKSVETG